MKALDTNILARYLRDDDVVQAKRAAHFIQRAVRLGEPLYLNHVVLCELAWILTSVYDHSKEEIISMMENILLTGQFEFEDKQSIEFALEDYRRTRADLADCLIGRRNSQLGCKATLTFDRRLKGIAAFEVI
ncbi:MAG TPA: type II toxin-antitoxin system VapC family toxin [Terriglobia bacterium]